LDLPIQKETVFHEKPTLNIRAKIEQNYWSKESDTMQTETKRNLG
jgi:hypothetical protein